jgi:U3 small nucleolar RNA-associated protein 18
MTTDPAAAETDEEEAFLQSQLFGKHAPLLPVPSSSAPLFKLDHKGAKRPAWVDSDDAAVKVDLASTDRLRKLRRTPAETEVEGGEYAERLKKQHRKLHGEHKWAAERDSGARPPGGGEDEGENEVLGLLAGSGSVTQDSKSDLLSLGRLQIARVKDANGAAPNKAVVQALDWHASGQVILTAGMDKTLRLFRVDGDTNPKIQSVCVADLPIMSAKFAGQDEIVLTGRRPFYFSHDCNTGHTTRVPGILGRQDKSLESMTSSPDGATLAFCLNDGFVSLVSRHTKREMLAVKLNASVRALSFCDAHSFIAAGDDGDVYKFDIRHANRRPVWKRRDEGSLGTRSLAASPSLYAAGSTSGVVNVYQQADGAKTSTLLNLTTSIDTLSFSPDGRLLLFASRRNKDALRLMHVPTKQVVANWPTARTPLSYVSSAAFSPQGGFLAIGNDKGKVLLYRLLGFDAA